MAISRIGDFSIAVSLQRYEDVMTGRIIAVGRHGNILVMVPYEIRGSEITPVTVHATDRKQITARIRAGRLETRRRELVVLAVAVHSAKGDVLLSREVVLL
ncbi:MAG: hypothetical protein D3908_00370 [Candidatus Electrothrix sp. AUS4]|nr:hypothetical protein [Candidatus Electrothrix sp. AUS4]